MAFSRRKPRPFFKKLDLNVWLRAFGFFLVRASTSVVCGLSGLGFGAEPYASRDLLVRALDPLSTQE